MATEEARQPLLHLPRIDFSGVEPSSPGAGRWSAVRAQVVDALATFGCFDAHYPALTPNHRAALFDGAVHAGGFIEAVHGAARRMEELEETVQRMVMEGLGVASSRYHGEMRESMRHVFRMSKYRPPTPGDGEGRKEVRYGTHQDCSTLSVVCQHGDVDGLEVQTADGEWVRYKPSSPTSLVVMAGNELRAWTNDRVRAPFHRIAVGGDVARYSAILFAHPGLRIQAPEELVDDEHPPRFKPHFNDDFMRFCITQGARRHEDKLNDFCGV